MVSKSALVTLLGAREMPSLVRPPLFLLRRVTAGFVQAFVASMTGFTRNAAGDRKAQRYEIAVCDAAAVPRALLVAIGGTAEIRANR